MKKKRVFATDEHGFTLINAKQENTGKRVVFKVFQGICSSLSVWFCVHLWLYSFADDLLRDPKMLKAGLSHPFTTRNRALTF